MPIEAFKKLWVSCHLLYPNSSQAKDIFGLVIESQSLENLIPGDTLELTLKLHIKLYSKLYRFYKKRNPVRSGSPFNEFQNRTLNIWKKTALKCTQDEIFILMMILSQKTTFEEVAEITRLHVSKIKYLFNQSVKKVITSPVLKFEQKKEIKLKEHESHEVSLLFINEYLIEYVLGLSDRSISEKLEQKLKENNRFNDYRNEITKFKDELTDLPVRETYEEHVKTISAIHSQGFKKIEVTKYKQGIILGIVLIFTVVALILRPSFLQTSNADQISKKLVLEEIAITKNEGQPILQTTSVKAVSAAAVAMQAKAVVSSAAVIAAANKLAKSQVVVAKEKEKQKIKAEQPPIQATGPLPTGVYRGVITVADFAQVSNLIRERVIAVGGKKAGEVELGWTKNQNVSYFHFIFPADKREDLIAYIQQYGNLDYKFEKHPRTIPLGHNRFILEVHKGEQAE